MNADKDMDELRNLPQHHRTCSKIIETKAPFNRRLSAFIRG